MRSSPLFEPFVVFRFAHRPNADKVQNDNSDADSDSSEDEMPGDEDESSRPFLDTELFNPLVEAHLDEPVETAQDVEDRLRTQRMALYDSDSDEMDFFSFLRSGSWGGAVQRGLPNGPW